MRREAAIEGRTDALKLQEIDDKGLSTPDEMVFFVEVFYLIEPHLHLIAVVFGIGENPFIYSFKIIDSRERKGEYPFLKNPCECGAL